jgi:hypothetical protein
MAVGFSSPGPAIAAGPDIQGHQIRLINAGMELEFSGGIGAGSANDLALALDANPAVHVVHLNSPGGLVVEGRRMFDLIRGHLLITTTDQYCFSACTLAFLGGRERYLAPGARLGFHGEFSDTADDSHVQAAQHQDMVTMLSLGIASDFVDKAFAAPKDRIWMPSAGELEDAHVITGVSNDYAVADGTKAPSADVTAGKSGGALQSPGGNTPAVEETPGGITIYRGPGQ